MKFHSGMMRHCVACLLAAGLGFFSTARAGLDRWAGHIETIDPSEASTILGAQVVGPQPDCSGVGGTDCERNLEDACTTTKNCGSATTTCAQIGKYCYSLTKKTSTYNCGVYKKGSSCCVDPEGGCYTVYRGRPGASVASPCNELGLGDAICVVNKGDCGTPIFKKCEKTK